MATRPDLVTLKPIQPSQEQQVSALNKFVSQTIAALTGSQISFRDLDVDLSQVTDIADAFPPLLLPGVVPQAVLLAGVFPSNANVVLTSAVQVHWRPTSSGIAVHYITGLTLGQRYTFRLMLVERE
jgi:hypothetical protein